MQLQNYQDSPQYIAIIPCHKLFGSAKEGIQLLVFVVKFIKFWWWMQIGNSKSQQPVHHVNGGKQEKDDIYIYIYINYELCFFLLRNLSMFNWKYLMLSFKHLKRLSSISLTRTDESGIYFSHPYLLSNFFPYPFSFISMEFNITNNYSTMR